ncbi:HD domain-containing protein [Sulfuritalea sp.]|uniref:HD domain-containing protein n=1 Tax=Sulfuritalea sp. TaxID=2480090 RepID=UPI001ACFD6E8|nr:HD domain-containing protein [Sulfuritalea sp.]MBN8476089.1 HD domain-containing protein [Sulfuritalea sp.]
MTIDSPFAALGNVSDTEEVEAQVDAIVRRFAPGHDLTRVDAAFSLLDRAFAGDLPGYQKLKTLYHNRTHTNEVVLCTARMLHGMQLAGQGLDGDHIDAALIGALMHDVGYLMRDDEASGTGAQFTDNHVLRGVEFARRHLQDMPAKLVDVTVKVILLTDHRKHPDWVRLDNVQQQRAAYATATADLIGQMANREYLERVLFLYYEFEEAQMGGFADIHDLLEKTTAFYRATKTRLEQDLNGLSAHLGRHFDQQTGIGRNFYQESIDRNLGYLERVVAVERDHRLEHLRRGQVVEKLLDMKGGR